MLQQTLSEWSPEEDLWVFAYASLIWRPEGQPVEVRPARVHGFHRALRMWSRVNRGTPQEPGLVFALISGGCCQGMVQRISRHDVPHYLPQLWQREMPYPAYDPRWLRVHTDQGPVRALGFTLARHSPHHTGELSSDTYHHIFKHASGLFGTTLDYAQQTFDQLQSLGITDHALGRLLQLADAPTPQAPPRILNQ